MSERNKKQMHRSTTLRPAFRTSVRRSARDRHRQAGLLSLRSFQRTFRSPTPINIFIDEIEQAAALFADISENTAEIWLAVGCATRSASRFASSLPRCDSTLPLGIQYLP